MQFDTAKSKVHRDWVKKNGTDIFKYSKNDAISFYITNIGFVG